MKSRLPNMYIYDPVQDNWTVGPEIPADRQRGACGVVVQEEKMYLVGGITDGHRSGHVAWLDEFDLKTEKWTKLPDAPRPRDHFQTAIIGDNLYVAGGRNTKAPDSSFLSTISDFDIYDFSTKSWSTSVQSIPTERAGGATVIVGKHLIIIGGESASSAAAHAENRGL